MSVALPTVIAAFSDTIIYQFHPFFKRNHINPFI
jgi:hypothetical protein